MLANHLLIDINNIQANGRLFQEASSKTNWERPKLDEVFFEKLTESENRGLIAPFSMEEIEVVKESDGNKSLDPDGFNFAFIKEFWYLIKNEVRILFDQFHENKVLPRSASYRTMLR